MYDSAAKDQSGAEKFETLYTYYDAITFSPC